MRILLLIFLLIPSLAFSAWWDTAPGGAIVSPTGSDRLPLEQSSVGYTITIDKILSVGSFESATSNDFDPDRLLGDTTDDNLIDDGLIPSTIARDSELFLNVVEDTTPQLGGTLDLNEKFIQLGDSPTDNTSHGLIINDTIAETVVACDALFLSSDGKWYQTDANVEAEAKGMQGMAAADGTGEHTGNVLLHGVCKNTTDLSYATVGAILYAPETVGEPTTTIPADTGDFVRVLGFVLEVDTIYFNPSNDYMER